MKLDEDETVLALENVQIEKENLRVRRVHSAVRHHPAVRL